MNLTYNTMRFGKKGRKITILHLKKPVQKGLAGMITSKLFPQKIALVVDDKPCDDLDYSFACLSYTPETAFAAIWIEENLFYGIKSGDKMARTTLFHELGHYYHKHFKNSKEEMDAYDEARSQMVETNQVIQPELDADQFAVDYLGLDYVIDGLTVLKSRLADRIECGAYDSEAGDVAIKELSLRIARLTELHK